MRPTNRPPTWQTLLAFSIVYLVWGSTFLAIRVGVTEVPPFLLAAMRFLLAGIILYIWMRAKGTASPSRREWASATLLAVLIFVFDYGLLFWAERSEEHTSELQSLTNLVCRLLLEKKKHNK